MVLKYSHGSPARCSATTTCLSTNQRRRYNSQQRQQRCRRYVRLSLRHKTMPTTSYCIWPVNHFGCHGNSWQDHKTCYNRSVSDSLLWVPIKQGQRVKVKVIEAVFVVLVAEQRAQNVGQRSVRCNNFVGECHHTGCSVWQTLYTN